jgi:Fe-S cluster biosynthesis and repair protein YggX
MWDFCRQSSKESHYTIQMALYTPELGRRIQDEIIEKKLWLKKLV